MTPLRLLRLAVEALESSGIPYFVTGSVASTYYGEPRMTNDIDIVVRLRHDHVSALTALFRAPAYYLDDRTMHEAIESHGMFNIIHCNSSLKLDMMVAAPTAFNASRFGRARRIDPEPDFSASIAAPEDVILKKLEYFRDGGSDKHLRDIRSMIRTQGNALDRGYIFEWAERLGVADEWAEVQRCARDSR